MNYETLQVIHDKAKNIMERIKTSTIYGEPVDLLNPEQILFAAYTLGEYDAKRPIGYHDVEKYYMDDQP